MTALKKLKVRSSGSAIPQLTIPMIKTYSIAVPNLEKQKEIVETLDIIDNHIQSLLTSYEEELKNLEELKKSILQKAFSGELTNKNKAA
jgi:type I restriction enzyme S subunit